MLQHWGGCQYWLTRLAFERALGILYLVAFAVAISQFRPLLGERGLLPVPVFLRAVSFRQAPSLFHLHYSDRFLAALAWLGAALAVGIVVGLLDVAPLWASLLVWLLLWTLYRVDRQRGPDLL